MNTLLDENLDIDENVDLESDLEDLVNDHRYTLVDYGDWYECVYNDLKEDMEAIGVTVEDMNFSGFCSQGDGASFTGTIASRNMRKFMDANKLADKFPAAYMFAKEELLWVTIKRTTSYHYHEQSVSIEVSEENLYLDFDAPLRQAVWNRMLEVWQDEEHNKFDDAVSSILRDHMVDFYRNLESEYDHLTSDECIIDYLLNNDQVPEHLVGLAKARYKELTRSTT